MHSESSDIRVKSFFAEEKLIREMVADAKSCKKLPNLGNFGSAFADDAANDLVGHRHLLGLNQPTNQSKHVPSPGSEPANQSIKSCSISWV